MLLDLDLQSYFSTHCSVGATEGKRADQNATGRSTVGISSLRGQRIHGSAPHSSNFSVQPRWSAVKVVRWADHHSLDQQQDLGHLISTGTWNSDTVPHAHELKSEQRISQLGHCVVIAQQLQ
jgi:hypothetical protein